MANARNASLETLYDDQFALLTQLIKPNYLEKYESSMIKLKKKKEIRQQLRLAVCFW